MSTPTLEETLRVELRTVLHERAVFQDRCEASETHIAQLQGQLRDLQRALLDSDRKREEAARLRWALERIRDCAMLACDNCREAARLALAGEPQS